MQDEVGGARVERRGVFVEQQDARRLQRRHQQADGLALAAGEQADAVAEAVLQAEAEGRQAFPETVAHRCLHRPAETATGTATLRQGHVLLDGEVLAGTRHGVLEHPRDAVGAAQTGLRVTSSSSIRICPLSIGRSPDTALRKVDLPAPLEPITVTNWPAGMSSDSRAGRGSRWGAGVEGDLQVLRAEHGQAPFLPSRRFFIIGITRATVTSTAVTRFRSWACKPMKSLFSARAMKKR